MYISQIVKTAIPVVRGVIGMLKQRGVQESSSTKATKENENQLCKLIGIKLSDLKKLQSIIDILSKADFVKNQKSAEFLGVLAKILQTIQTNLKQEKTVAMEAAQEEQEVEQEQANSAAETQAKTQTQPEVKQETELLGVLLKILTRILPLLLGIQKTLGQRADVRKQFGNSGQKLQEAQVFGANEVKKENSSRQNDVIPPQGEVIKQTVEDKSDAAETTSRETADTKAMGNK